jgi:1-acyl-sn-glycerol-3-phosphate acyltransferase
MKMFYSFCLHLVRPFLKLLFPYRAAGTENIPRGGKLVLCSNHCSVIDPVFLAACFPRQIRYMAKSELFTDHGPLARWLLNRLGAFPVHRGKGDAQSLKTAVGILDAEGVVGIFPQGKCVFDHSPFQPKAGAVLAAAKAKSPILPAAIRCSGRVRPFRKVVIRFGAVVPYESLGLKDDSAASVKKAAGMVARSINLLLEEAD